jgi:hypothetical protein
MKMAKLRKMLTHPGKNESGQGVLAIVLILLMLGAIILTPLLVFMSTGLKAGGVYESKMQEFYAADAGVEDAIWNITYANLTTPANYTLADEVNNRTTNVTVEPISSGGYSGYKIVSTATSNSGGNTTVECYYGTLDYSGLLDSAITSNGSIILPSGMNNVNVNGSINTPYCSVKDNCANCTDCPNCTCCCSYKPVSWPTAETLSAYYWDQVKDSLYSDGDIDVSDPSIALGAWYTEPPYTNYVFDIDNSYPKTVVNATLNGTVYVRDYPSTQYDLSIGTTQQDFALNLSNKTIFCEGGIEVGGKCTITGSGCIIAVGDILFQPKSISGSNTTFVFILSINGTATAKPSGTFYGAIAGKNTVMEYGGEHPSITWTGLNNTGVLNFPAGKANMKVLSYTIK